MLARPPVPDRGVLRLSRAAVVATAAVGASAGGHLSGGGAPAAPATGVALALVTFVAVLALSGRRWTFGRLLVAFGVAQAGYHVALAASETAPAGPAGPDAMGAGVMAAGHLFAAVVLAGVVARGEAVLWRLAEFSAGVAGAWRPQMVPVVPARNVRSPVRPAAVLPVRVTDRYWCAADPLRGPPR